MKLLFLKLYKGDFFFENNKNITLNETQHYMHKLRLKHDAIVVGFNTYKDDSPKLNCRLNGIDKKIIPYVLTNELNKKIKFPQIVFKNNTHFDNFFSILNKKPVQSVLIEGGLQTFKKFLINRVFNEVVICQSSKSIKKSKKRYKLDKKLIESRCKKMNSQIYLKDKIDTYLNV